MGVPLRHDCTGHRRAGGGAARRAVHHAGASRPLSAVPGAAFDSRRCTSRRGGLGGGRPTRRATPRCVTRPCRAGRGSPPSTWPRRCGGRRSRWIMYQDGDQHRRVRELLTSTFTPRSVEALRPYVAHAGRGSPRPSLGPRRVRAGGRAGLPAADHRDRRADRHPRARPGAVPRLEPRHPRRGRGKGTGAGGQMEAANRATLDSEDVPAGSRSRARVRSPARRPGDAARRSPRSTGRRLTEDEVVSNLNVLVGAGFETTVFMLGSSVLALLDHPDQLARPASESGHRQRGGRGAAALRGARAVAEPAGRRWRTSSCATCRSPPASG